MPITISIRDVPDEIADRLRERAKRNHRSLQGELMALMERAAEQPGLREDQRDYRVELPKAESGVVTKKLLDEIAERARARNLGGLGESSTKIIRRMRDERYGLPKK
jgi:plasmid stability protein